MYHTESDLISEMSSSDFPMIIGDLVSFEMKMTTAETINSFLSELPFKLENFENFEKNDFMIEEDSMAKFSNIKNCLKEKDLIVNPDNIPVSLIAPSGKIKNEMFVNHNRSDEFSSEKEKVKKNSKSNILADLPKKDLVVKPVKKFLGKKAPPRIFKKYKISQNDTKEIGFKALKLYQKISKIEETDLNFWDYYQEINKLKSQDQDVVFFMRDFFMIKEITKLGKKKQVFMTTKVNSNEIKNKTTKVKTKKLIDMTPEEQLELVNIIQNLSREQVKQIRKYLRNSEKMNPENFKFSLSLVKNSLWNKFVLFLSECDSKNKQDPLHVPWNDQVI
jgi:hypothetical protein